MVRLLHLEEWARTGQPVRAAARRVDAQGHHLPAGVITTQQDLTGSQRFLGGRGTDIGTAAIGVQQERPPREAGDREGLLVGH